MPDVNSVDLITALRLQHPRLPLILLTTLGDQERRRVANELPQSIVIYKPVKPSYLLDAMMSLLGKGDVAAPARSGTLAAPVNVPHRPWMRILLAEDNAVNQQVALRMLQRLGYRADMAANGLEVLEALNRQPYDVVLMDVQMPELDGLEASRQIRQRWPEAHKPWIIAMTANALRGDRERCLEAGMNDYVSKPIQLAQLSEVINRALPDAEEPTPPANAAADALPVLDITVLEQLCEELGDGDPAIVLELLELFLRDSRQLVQALQTAHAQNNTNDLVRAVHTLKSTSASIGAQALASHCQEIEHLSRTNRLHHPEQAIARLVDAYNQAVVALEAAQARYSA
jgi:CheY-like chemotaxis protein